MSPKICIAKPPQVGPVFREQPEPAVWGAPSTNAGQGALPF